MALLAPLKYLQGLPAALTGAAIRSYQKHISPRKGFACAHRVRHGGASCSEAVRRAVAQHGILGAVPLARAQFAECKLAARELREVRRARAAYALAFSSGMASGALVQGMARGDLDRRKEKLCDTCEVADFSCETIECGQQCGDASGCDGCDACNALSCN